MLIAGKGGTI